MIKLFLDNHRLHYAIKYKSSEQPGQSHFGHQQNNTQRSYMYKWLGINRTEQHQSYQRYRHSFNICTAQKDMHESRKITAEDSLHLDPVNPFIFNIRVDNIPTRSRHFFPG